MCRQKWLHHIRHVSRSDALKTLHLRIMMADTTKAWAARDSPREHMMARPVRAGPSRAGRPEQRDHWNSTCRGDVHGSGIIGDHDSRF